MLKQFFVRYRLQIIILGIACFLFAFAIIALNSNKEKIVSKEVESPEKTVKPVVEMTAKEVIKVTNEKAAESIDEPFFWAMNSTDDSDELASTKAGIEGKRKVWNISYGNKDGNKRISYKVNNGIITVLYSEDYSESSENYTKENAEIMKSNMYKFEISDILIDSDEALEIAIEQKGLKPGDPKEPEDWLIGYHYSIAEVYLSEDVSDKSLVIVVSGISPNGNRANITIEQSTGKILGAAETIGYDEEGRSEWKAF